MNAFGSQRTMEKGLGGDLSYRDNVSIGNLLGKPHLIPILLYLDSQHCS